MATALSSTEEDGIFDNMNSDREEGEIIDDDFEDISDNSIILPLLGKSETTKEQLPVISLSSVSESEEAEKCHRRKKPMRRKRTKSCRKRKHGGRKRNHCTSHNHDSIKLDRNLLKAAIHVDNQECFKNSLRSRLRAMTKLDENPSDNQDNNAKSEDLKASQEPSSDDGDNELVQLRLEALRTAVLNKYQHRKKRKFKELQEHDKLSDMYVKTDDKENSDSPNKNIENHIGKKTCIETSVESKEDTNNIVIENNTPPEDDEDVLRALLLASMAKKITKETDLKKTMYINNLNNGNTNKLVKQPAAKVLNNGTSAIMNTVGFKNRLVKNNLKSQPLQVSKVKPIIITVNGDSDSDDDLPNKALKEQPKKLDIEIQNSVDKFLKEQRAKVEAEAFKPKPVIMNKSGIFVKSSMKLLPKVKQIEYQNLLQKLRNARKPSVKHIPNKMNDKPKQIINNSKKIVRNKTAVTKVPDTQVVPDLENDARALQKVLKEMQLRKNGRFITKNLAKRLQMQAKYTVLTPIVKKINEASMERKKYDKEVKRLVEEWSQAKKKLQETHQHFAFFVKELIAKKNDIDKSSLEHQTVTRGLPVTSTPVRENTSFESFETSRIPKTSSPLLLNARTGDNLISPDTKDDKKGLDDSDVSINPGDPNDIDKIYYGAKCIIPKYISPLDNFKRVDTDDPFLIMCPYDVDGNCRDSDCIYKHYRA